jgi:hypothetical protein
MSEKNLRIAKITAPDVSGVALRKRLFLLLDRCRKKPVVWITGPAGSGKTTLVADYLKRHRLPCLWYQLDEGDGDLAAFFYYMALAAKKAAPRYRKAMPLLTPEYLQGIEVFARRWFEELFRRLDPSSVLVFDNYQDVPADSLFHSILGCALDTIPAGFSVIVLSRSEPPGGLARLRGGNRIAFISAGEGILHSPGDRRWSNTFGHERIDRRKRHRRGLGHRKRNRRKLSGWRCCFLDDGRASDFCDLRTDKQSGGPLRRSRSAHHERMGDAYFYAVHRTGRSVLYEEKETGIKSKQDAADHGDAAAIRPKKERMMNKETVSRVFLTVVAILITVALAGLPGTALAAGANGTKLPANGGAPGKDYMTYLSALKKKDGATIRKMAEVPPGTSDKELQGQMEMMSAMTPTDQKIVSGTMHKDTAVLKVTGRLEGKKQYGRIEMQKKGGVWKITKEDWSETPKK